MGFRDKIVLAFDVKPSNGRHQDQIKTTTKTKEMAYKIAKPIIDELTKDLTHFSKNYKKTSKTIELKVSKNLVARTPTDHGFVDFELRAGNEHFLYIGISCTPSDDPEKPTLTWVGRQNTRHKKTNLEPLKSYSDIKDWVTKGLKEEEHITKVD